MGSLCTFCKKIAALPVSALKLRCSSSSRVYSGELDRQDEHMPDEAFIRLMDSFADVAQPYSSY
jgi:hypothetical protein